VIAVAVVAASNWSMPMTRAKNVSLGNEPSTLTPQAVDGGFAPFDPTGIPRPVPSMSVYSAVDPATLPAELRVTAMSEEDRVVMGLRHVALPMEGVQFHPESVLTPEGPHLLANFLRLAGEGEAGRLDAATGTFATSGLAEAGVGDAAAAGDPAAAADAADMGGAADPAGNAGPDGTAGRAGVTA